MEELSELLANASSGHQTRFLFFRPSPSSDWYRARRTRTRSSGLADDDRARRAQARSRLDSADRPGVPQNINVPAGRDWIAGGTDDICPRGIHTFESCRARHFVQNRALKVLPLLRLMRR